MITKGPRLLCPGPILFIEREPSVMRMRRKKFYSCVKFITPVVFINSYKCIKDTSFWEVSFMSCLSFVMCRLKMRLTGLYPKPNRSPT